MLISWRVVGYSGRDQDIATIYFYHSGTWNILTSSFLLIVVSFLMQTNEMELEEAFRIGFSFKESMEFVKANPEISSIVWIFFLSGQAIIFLWGLWAWEAYKKIYEAGWVSSIVSLIIFCVGCSIILISFSFVWASIYTDNTPQTVALI